MQLQLHLLLAIAVAVVLPPHPSATVAAAAAPPKHSSFAFCLSTPLTGVSLSRFCFFFFLSSVARLVAVSMTVQCARDLLLLLPLLLPATVVAHANRDCWPTDVHHKLPNKLASQSSSLYVCLSVCRVGRLLSQFRLHGVSFADIYLGIVYFM